MAKDTFTMEQIAIHFGVSEVLCRWRISQVRRASAIGEMEALAIEQLENQPYTESTTAM